MGGDRRGQLALIGHLLIALALQSSVRAFARNWWAGAAAGAAWSVSREIAQAEYRWIEQFGAGLRANMPWWGGLDPAVWPKADQWLDWIVPTFAVLGVAWVATRWERRRRL